MPEIPPASEEETFCPTTNTNRKPCLKHSQTPTVPVIRTSELQRSPHTPHPHRKQPLVHGCSDHPLLRNRLDAINAHLQDGRAAMRPISKVVTMRLTSSPQQQAPINLQANFEISKIQAAPGSLGQLRLNPSQQTRPAMLATPSFNFQSATVIGI